MDCFAKLPDEVILRIFEHLKAAMMDTSRLSLRERLLDVRLTNKRFHRLAWDLSLAGTLAFHTSNKFYSIMKAFDQRPFLQKLVLDSVDINFLEALLYLAMQAFPTLRCLIFVRPSTNWTKEAVEKIGQFSQLEELQIGFTEEPPHLELFLRSTLRKLTLTSTKLTDELLISLPDNCPKLEHLSLNAHDILAEDLTLGFLVLIEKLKLNLCNLSLDLIPITNQMIEAIGTCHNLQSLTLDFRSRADLKFDPISYLKNLRTLKLRNGESLNTQQVEKLFGDFKMGSLRHLEFGNCCNVSHKSMEFIMTNCLLLESIGLNTCCLIDGTILFEMKKLKHLRRVEMQGQIGVTKELILHLVCTLKGLKGLNFVDCPALLPMDITNIGRAHPRLQMQNSARMY